MNKALFIVGDTIDFETTVASFPPQDGWTLKYRLVPRSVDSPVITFNANPNGDGYRVQVGSDTTSTWEAGEYTWFSYVEQSGGRVSINKGPLEIKLDPSQLQPGYDGRTDNEKAVDDLKAAMVNYQATNGAVKSYSIGNRSMTFRDGGELVVALNRAKEALRDERIRTALAKGLPDPRKIGVRFNRV